MSLAYKCTSSSSISFAKSRPEFSSIPQVSCSRARFPTRKVRVVSRVVEVGSDDPGSTLADTHKKSFKLVMMRHAQSVPPGAGIRDHDRTVTISGKLAAKECAFELKAAGWLPDLILCSDSKRTKETLEVMSSEESAFESTETHYLSSLYTIAALDGLTRLHLQEQMLERVDQNTSCVMCVGHNRGWEEAVSDFCGTAIELQTGNAALLEARGDSWEEVLKQSEAFWHLHEVIRPQLSSPQQSFDEPDRIAEESI